MKFLSHDIYDVDHMYEIFQGQKMHKKNSYSSILGKRFSPLFLTTTPIDRFGMSLFFVGLLDLNFFTCVNNIEMFLL
jgi:hypothetical protein